MASLDCAVRTSEYLHRLDVVVLVIFTILFALVGLLVFMEVLIDAIRYIRARKMDTHLSVSVIGAKFLLLVASVFYCAHLIWRIHELFSMSPLDIVQLRVLSALYAYPLSTNVVLIALVWINILERAKALQVPEHIAKYKLFLWVEFGLMIVMVFILTTIASLESTNEVGQAVNAASSVIFLLFVLSVLGICGYRAVNALRWVNSMLKDSPDGVVLHVARRKTIYLLAAFVALFLLFVALLIGIVYPVSERTAEAYLVLGTLSFINDFVIVVLFFLIVERYFSGHPGLSGYYLGMTQHVFTSQRDATGNSSKTSKTKHSTSSSSTLSSERSVVPSANTLTDIMFSESSSETLVDI